MKKIKIRSNAEQILREMFGELNDLSMTFKRYVELNAENEPGFFRWLFDDDSIGDYQVKPEQEEVYKEFLNTITR